MATTNLVTQVTSLFMSLCFFDPSMILCFSIIFTSIYFSVLCILSMSEIVFQFLCFESFYSPLVSFVFSELFYEAYDVTT